MSWGLGRKKCGYQISLAANPRGSLFPARKTAGSFLPSRRRTMKGCGDRGTYTDPASPRFERRPRKKPNPPGSCTGTRLGPRLIIIWSECRTTPQKNYGFKSVGVHTVTIHGQISAGHTRHKKNVLLYFLSSRFSVWHLLFVDRSTRETVYEIVVLSILSKLNQHTLRRYLRMPQVFGSK